MRGIEVIRWCRVDSPPLDPLPPVLTWFSSSLLPAWLSMSSSSGRKRTSSRRSRWKALLTCPRLKSETCNVRKEVESVVSNGNGIGCVGSAISLCTISTRMRGRGIDGDENDCRASATCTVTYSLRNSIRWLVCMIRAIDAWSYEYA